MSASLWSVELREVVIRIFGTGGASVEKMVGNLAARASGVKSRFVLLVDWVGDVARSVAVLVFEAFVCFATSTDSSSLADSIMLSLSSSSPSDTSSSSSLSPSSNAACSSSTFRFFNLSTFTETPSPSPTSLSTSSHTLFLSNVSGMFCFSLSSRNVGSLSSSRRRRNRSSRLMLSVALFLLMWRDCRLSLFLVLKGRWAFGESLSFLEAIVEDGRRESQRILWD